MEIIVVAPNADWPAEALQRAKANGIYLGFKPPEQAAAVLAGADALLVLMSFEREHELFMRTSFTTKFLDYTAFGKPIILWGPEYCTPVRVVRRDGGALVVDQPKAERVVDAARHLKQDCNLRQFAIAGARDLNNGIFNPEILQEIFVSRIEALVSSHHAPNKSLKT